MDTMQTGANIDERPLEDKERDYILKEVVASAASPNWTEKPVGSWRQFPIVNQNGSGSCVAQTEAKELGIMRFLKDGVFIPFSATDIYQRRSNKPLGGMSAIDARAIAQAGVTLEVLAPSQSLTDTAMDTMVIEDYKRDIGRIFSVPNYIASPIQDIDSVASTIEATQKGVMVWFYFTAAEWTGTPQVIDQTLTLTSGAALRHSVTAVDYTLVNGEKALIIEDSWGKGAGIGGRRIITESFYKKRNWYAGYLMNFRFDGDQSDGTTRKPTHVFTKPLHFSLTFTTDPDVVKLQQILRYESLFPLNVDITGYYGAITASAVKAFQIKHRVASPSEIESLQGKVVGPKTIQKLNQLYGL